MRILITNRLPDSVMVGTDKPAFHASLHVTAITFLFIGIIGTSILFVFTLVLNQNHTTKAFQCLSKLYNVPDGPTLSRISTTSFNSKISYHLVSMIIIINQI